MVRKVYLKNKLQFSFLLTKPLPSLEESGVLIPCLGTPLIKLETSFPAILLLVRHPPEAIVSTSDRATVHTDNRNGRIGGINLQRGRS